MQNKCKNARLTVYFQLPSLWLFLCRTLYGVSHWSERHANSQTASYTMYRIFCRTSCAVQLEFQLEYQYYQQEYQGPVCLGFKISSSPITTSSVLVIGPHCNLCQILIINLTNEMFVHVTCTNILSVKSLVKIYHKLQW